MLTDAHCHLEFSQFDDDRDAVLQRAAHMLIIDSVIRESQVATALDMASRHDNIHLCMGHPPSDMEEDGYHSMVRLIREHAGKLIGLGEVGLDHHWVKDEEGQTVQEERFISFIGLSKELGLPLVIHSRDAEARCIGLLAEHEAPAMLHCFSGNVDQALEAVDLGCLISIPTNVSYVKSRQRLAREVPLSSLCLETDAPYLSPQMGDRNEPANIEGAAKKVAKIRGISPQEVEDATTANIRGFFGI